MINLLPNSIREEHTYGRRNRMLVALILLIAGTATMVVAIMLFNLVSVKNDTNDVQSAIDQNKLLIANLESETSDLSKVSTRLSTTYKLFEGSIKFSELIPKIGSVLPSGTIIGGLSLTGGSTDPLQLNVSLKSPDLVPVLQKNLVESDIFEAADVVDLSPGGEGTEYPYSASVTVSFEGTAEAKRKEAARAAAEAEAKKALEEESE
jgi:hypothetical protein